MCASLFSVSSELSVKAPCPALTRRIAPRLARNPNEYFCACARMSALSALWAPERGPSGYDGAKGHPASLTPLRGSSAHAPESERATGRASRALGGGLLSPGFSRARSSLLQRSQMRKLANAPAGVIYRTYRERPFLLRIPLCANVWRFVLFSGFYRFRRKY